MLGTVDWATFTLERSLFLISKKEQSLCFLSVIVALETYVVYDKGIGLKEDYQINSSEHAWNTENLAGFMAYSVELITV